MPMDGDTTQMYGKMFSVSFHPFYIARFLTKNASFILVYCASALNFNYLSLHSPSAHEPSQHDMNYTSSPDDR